MTVEEIRGGSGAQNDRFPVGMRVLAVDDDRTCLKLLESLLRKCQYQVSTTSEAKTALQMLRENRSRYDLVITDVEMPDIDGFKLLELVGLEMDLPVIMLSSHGDTARVMKGITHGACDYLVKPVRIEELKNIFQHVLRRKKSESKSSNLDKDHQENGGGVEEHAATANANGKLNRKRKDEEEEDDEENEDSTTQKKPRLIWTADLHGKFVAVVNQLGLKKAVPKRILDMMNIEGISRENVASHLQKYRLYLKKISSMESQGANMIAALAEDSFREIVDFQTFSGSGRFSNSGLSVYQTGGILGRLSSPGGMSLHDLSSSALIQQNHAQNLSGSLSNLGKPYSVISPANQNNGLIQRNPTLLKIDQFQQSKCASGIPEFISSGVPATVAGNTLPFGNSSNSLTCASRNSLLLQGNPQQRQCGGLFSSQTAVKVTSLNSEPFNAGISGSTFLDNSRCNQNLQNTIQLSKFPPNPLPLSECLTSDLQPTNSLGNVNFPAGLLIRSKPVDFSSTNTISAPMEDSRGEFPCQRGLVGDFVRDTNLATDQRWGEHRQGYTHNSNHIVSTLNSMLPSNAVMGPLGQVLDQNYGVCITKTDAYLVNQSNSGVSNLMQLSDIEKSAMNSQTVSSEDYRLEQTKSQVGFAHDGHDSLDDEIDAMIKRVQVGTELMEGELGFDSFSFPSCQ